MKTHAKTDTRFAALMLGVLWMMLTSIPAIAQTEMEPPLLGRLQRFMAAMEQAAVLNALNTPEIEEDIAFLDSLPQSRTEDGAFVLGDRDAPITIVEFADWACSHCQDYHPTVKAFIRDEVATGRANYEFRVFPTAGGALTYIAGAAAECAEAQGEGNFWRAYTLLYALGATTAYNESLGELLVTRLDLDSEALTECIADSTRVSTDVALGQESEVTGTPAVRVRYNGGALEPLEAEGISSEEALSAVVEAAQ